MRRRGEKEMAEGEGFEPPVPQCGTTIFKTVAFVRSATPPVCHKSMCAVSIAPVPMEA